MVRVVEELDVASSSGEDDVVVVEPPREGDAVEGGEDGPGRESDDSEDGLTFIEEEDVNPQMFALMEMEQEALRKNVARPLSDFVQELFGEAEYGSVSKASRFDPEFLGQLRTAVLLPEEYEVRMPRVAERIYEIPLVARDDLVMASKNFKVDRNAVLHPTPRLLADKAPGKEALGNQPKEREREKESSTKRKGVEVTPPPSTKRTRTVVTKEKPGGGEPREKEVVVAAGKASGGSSAFPVRPMNPSAMGAPTVLEGSGSSGAAGREMALVPTSWPKPQGPNGDCCITFRSFKGWIPEDHRAKRYPTECFKAFSLLQGVQPASRLEALREALFEFTERRAAGCPGSGKAWI